MAKTTRTPGPARKHILGAALELGQKTGKVGWFESAKYADGTPVAGVAYVQEFGGRRIPPRPTLRPTADTQAGEWSKTAATVSKAVMRGQLQPTALFEALCLKAEGDVREAITKLTSPPLAESTIAARRRRLAPGSEVVDVPPVMGIAKPLVDTGILLNTLTSKVE